MLKRLIAIAGVALAMSGGVASAATINFSNGADGGGTLRFKVDCSSCAGWLFDAETAGAVVNGIGSGGLIDFKDQNYAAGQGEAWEEDLLDNIADEVGGSNIVGSFSKTDTPSTTFTTSAEYILFKIGNKPDIGVLLNLTGASQEFVFSTFTNNLSHLAFYDVPGGGGGGGNIPVPLPATLPMLLGALAIGGISLRKRVRAA